MKNGQPQRDDERVQRIIGEGNYEALVSFADELGKKLVEEKLTTSQIRNVFGEVKRLQMRFNTTGTLDEKRLRMLKPKLAYMAARAKEGGGTLRSVLSSAVDEIFVGDNRDERFCRLTDFFEAILAYHKRYGGRD